MSQIFDPLQDGISRVELLHYFGGDLDVVNDARASFERVSLELDDRDVKLIHYLIKHQHTSPLRGTVFKFKIKAPLFVARQWWKHVIASSHNDEQVGWNEKSFRYVQIDDANEFYIPATFRQQSASNKQASADPVPDEIAQQCREIYVEQCRSSYDAYQKLLSLGVAREQARGVLIPTVYTAWVWTVSLQALLHFIDLRLGKGAQNEIQAYARTLFELVQPIVPETIRAWEASGTNL